jgi:hypothetical protein
MKKTAHRVQRERERENSIVYYLDHKLNVRNVYCRKPGIHTHRPLHSFIHSFIMLSIDHKI